MRRENVPTKLKIIPADCEFLRMEDGKRVLVKVISPDMIVIANLAPLRRKIKAIAEAFEVVEVLRQH